MAHSLFESLEPRFCLSHTPTAVDFEQYMIELINRARANPAAEAARQHIDLNEGLAANTITTDPKQPLAYNPDIAAAARTHSKWMLDNQLFQHNGANNDSPSIRMTDAGYVFSTPSASAENIGWTGSNGTLNETALTLQLHNGLFIDSGIAGRGHRTNLMNPDLREMGAGVLTGLFDSYNAVMITNDFASSGANPGPFLTGVAYADTVTADHFYTPGEGLPNLTITATRLSDNQTFTTTTSAAGGYSLELSPGTYDITSSGTGLSSPITLHNVTLSTQNVKEDFVPGSSGGDGGGTPALSVAFTSSLPATLKPGQSTKITLRFRNTGTAAYTGTLNPNLYFSTDTTIAAPPDLLIAHTSKTLSLAVGQSYSFVFTVPSPITLGDAKYHLLAADGDTPIAGSATTVHIIPPTTNLIPTFSGSLKKSHAGAIVPFTLKLKNKGTGLAAGTLSLALSLHPAKGGTDVVLPTQSNIAINIKANATSNLKRTITLPSDLPAGPYKLIATLTATLSTAESNTKDNTATSALFSVS